MLTAMQMTISEAAEVLQVSSHTVRRRLANGQLNGHKQPTAQGFVWKVEIEGENSQPNGRSPENNALLQSYEDRIEDLKEELEARRQEIGELHRLLAARSLESGAKRPWWRFWG